MDKIFLIGHRGVGKTTLLKDFSLKSIEYKCYDLDSEIEKRSGIKITELFQKGEVKKFRDLEIKILNEILLEHPRQIIALGAGFELEHFSFNLDDTLLWLRRITDSQGRIFFDRPKLTQESDPLKEWNHIFSDREAKYKKYSNAQLYIPEYFDFEFNPLFEYLHFTQPEKGFVTFLPKENDRIIQSKNLNVELRTDILSEEEIYNFLKCKKNGHVILAIRKNIPSLAFLNQIIVDFSDLDITIDWDLNLGEPDLDYASHIKILSSHSDNGLQDIQKLLQNLDLDLLDYHFKVSPQLGSVEQALKLEQEIKTNLNDYGYSYLPRSNNDFDLSFFRQLQSYNQTIGFYRFGEGSSKDQPFWWQWPKEKPKGFFGIYGDKIKHSYTPSFHKKYFEAKNIYPLSIDGLDDLSEYLGYFAEQKLKTLAVTSPYKKQMYSLTNFKKTFLSDQNFSSVNTFLFKNLLSFNTDYYGLKIFLEAHLNLNDRCLVWGGGALLEQLEILLPNALFFSARDGKIKQRYMNKEEGQIIDNELGVNLNQPVPLIWASGEKGLNPDNIPTSSISKVIDLDYRENAKGRLFSFMNHIDYISGLEFFINQAKAQQQIWDEYEL